MTNKQEKSSGAKQEHQQPKVEKSPEPETKSWRTKSVAVFDSADSIKDAHANKGRK